MPVFDPGPGRRRARTRAGRRRRTAAAAAARRGRPRRSRCSRRCRAPASGWPRPRSPGSDAASASSARPGGVRRARATASRASSLSLDAAERRGPAAAPRPGSSRAPFLRVSCSMWNASSSSSSGSRRPKSAEAAGDLRTLRVLRDYCAAARTRPTAAEKRSQLFVSSASCLRPARVSCRTWPAGCSRSCPTPLDPAPLLEPMQRRVERPWLTSRTSSETAGSAGKCPSRASARRRASQDQQIQRALQKVALEAIGTPLECLQEFMALPVEGLGEFFLAAIGSLHRRSEEAL